MMFMAPNNSPHNPNPKTVISTTHPRSLIGRSVVEHDRPGEPPAGLRRSSQRGMGAPGPLCACSDIYQDSPMALHNLTRLTRLSAEFKDVTGIDRVPLRHRGPERGGGRGRLRHSGARGADCAAAPESSRLGPGGAALTKYRTKVRP